MASSTLSLPADNYIYSIVPSAPGTFAAISSDDSLRVFNAADLDRASVISDATHNGGVTALRSFAMGESHLLATGGRDGKVKVWDVRAGNGSPVVEMETGEFVLVKLFFIIIFFLRGRVLCIYCLLGLSSGTCLDKCSFVFCCCISGRLLLVFGEFIDAWIQGWSWLGCGFRCGLSKCIFANSLSYVSSEKITCSVCGL